ncbi:hypothetical protein [Paenibacillus nanensis]|uniref:hypothetical protein n=1 Tax=Paenibacillus nanensis TaxID=393251 RepID=UPI001F0C3D2A|nr:hypothetical protein [Paenibacillus nanensis]
MNKTLWFKEEKLLAWTGVLGVVMALLCGIGALLYGVEDTPGKGLAKAFSFNAALGVFLLSTAAISPLSGMKPKGKAVFRWTYFTLALYSYFAETVQHARGVNPRFVEDGSAFDSLVANGFAFVALLLVVFYLFFAAQFFRKRSYALQPEIVMSIRYAMVAVLLSFAGGIWISVNGGRDFGADGNLIWFHGLGFHAIQALPIVGWLTMRATMPAMAKRMIIHVSGIAFLGGLLAIGWQTALERTLAEWTLLPLAALAFFLVVTAAGARALLEAVRSTRAASAASK